MKRTMMAVVAAMAAGVVTLAPSVGAAAAAPVLEPAVPGRPIPAWAWCGVHPDDATAATAAATMATVAGIDVTFGPCNDPIGQGLPYSPAEPGTRYVSPALYRRLVDINAAAGMRTVVYDKRMWDPSPTVRNEAIAFWTPVLQHVAAWDMGDEFNPDEPEWDVLVERWQVVLGDATARTGIRPFANHLWWATDEAFADLPGSDLLMSFTRYDEDRAASVARDNDARVNTVMCGVNAFDHLSYHPSASSIRNDMAALTAAGCDQFLVFGGQRVYDSDDFGDGSLVDRQGLATEWAPAVLEGSGTSSYTPINPARVLETRVGDGLSTVDGDFNGIGMRAANSVLELGISGRAGVPSRAVSVVVNVTVTNSFEAGFVTVYPCGTRPNAAQLNHAAGATVSTTVVAKLSTRGSVCLFTLSDVDLVVDVNGYYPEGTSFTATAPARLLETRAGDGLSTVDGQFNGIGRRVGGSVTQLDATGRAGIPSSARAVVLSVTATGSTAPGFVTVFPCGGAVPTAATVNYAAGATSTNAAVVQVGGGGTVCLFTMADVDLVVDVNGYHPAGSTFATFAPARLMETRAGDGLSTVDGLLNGAGLRSLDTVTSVQVATRAGLPRTMGSVVLNVTVTEPRRDGFVVVFACDAPRPNAAHVNYVAGSTVSNMVIADVGASGSVCIYTMSATHLVVDVAGYHP